MTTTNAIESVRLEVNSYVRLGEQAEQKFTDTVKKYGLTYAIEWARDTIEAIETARLGREVFRIAQDVSNVDDTLSDEAALMVAIRAVVAECKRQLLNDSIHSASTSMLTNAVSAAKAAATVRFVTYIGSALEYIDRQDS